MDLHLVARAEGLQAGGPAEGLVLLGLLDPRAHPGLVSEPVRALGVEPEAEEPRNPGGGSLAKRVGDRVEVGRRLGGEHRCDPRLPRRLQHEVGDVLRHVARRLIHHHDRARRLSPLDRPPAGDDEVLDDEAGEPSGQLAEALGVERDQADRPRALQQRVGEAEGAVAAEATHQRPGEFLEPREAARDAVAGGAVGAQGAELTGDLTLELGAAGGVAERAVGPDVEDALDGQRLAARRQHLGAQQQAVAHRGPVDRASRVEVGAEDPHQELARLHRAQPGERVVALLTGAHVEAQELAPLRRREGLEEDGEPGARLGVDVHAAPAVPDQDRDQAAGGGGLAGAGMAQEHPAGDELVAADPRELAAEVLAEDDVAASDTVAAPGGAQLRAASQRVQRAAKGLAATAKLLLGTASVLDLAKGGHAGAENGAGGGPHRAHRSRRRRRARRRPPRSDRRWARVPAPTSNAAGGRGIRTSSPR